MTTSKDRGPESDAKVFTLLADAQKQYAVYVELTRTPTLAQLAKIPVPVPPRHDLPISMSIRSDD